MNPDIYARDTLDDIKSDSGHNCLLVQTLLEFVVQYNYFILLSPIESCDPTPGCLGWKSRNSQ